MCDLDLLTEHIGFNLHLDPVELYQFPCRFEATTNTLENKIRDLACEDIEGWINSPLMGLCREFDCKQRRYMRELTMVELESDRYPGFSLLPLDTQLEFVSDALLVKFPHPDTFKLVSLFNLVNNNQGNMMVTSSACGNIHVIKRLLTRLRQVQKLINDPKYQNCCLPLDTINKFQADGFQMLGLLSRAQCGREIVLSEGGLRLIIDQIASVPLRSNIFRFCSFALGNLISELSDDEEGTCKKFIQKEKIIEMLLQGLRESGDDWQMAKFVCFAIGNIAYIGDFEETFIKEKAIELVLSTMQRHSQYPLLQTDAVFFLKNSAYGEIGRKLIISNGGVEIILEAMKNHEDHSELLELSINVLFDLTFSGAVNFIVANSDGIELILRAISKHKNEELLREALRALLRIYSTCNEQQKIIIIKAGATEVLRKLKINPCSVTLSSILHDILFAFSQEKVSHQRMPVQQMPSFTEICARTVTNKAIYVPHQHLPEELNQYLKSSKSCSHCGKSYYEQFHERIQLIKFPEYSRPLPTFLTLCSVECFQQTN